MSVDPKASIEAFLEDKPETRKALGGASTWLQNTKASAKAFVAKNKSVLIALVAVAIVCIVIYFIFMHKKEGGSVLPKIGKKSEEKKNELDDLIDKIEEAQKPSKTK